MAPKIVVNVGVGRHLENQKLKQDITDTVISTLTQISGQKPVLDWPRNQWPTSRFAKVLLRLQR